MPEFPSKSFARSSLYAVYANSRKFLFFDQLFASQNHVGLLRVVAVSRSEDDSPFLHQATSEAKRSGYEVRLYLLLGR